MTTETMTPLPEVEPRCDICGEPEDHEVGWFENDWNGETGNHLSCEADEARKASRAEA